MIASSGERKNPAGFPQPASTSIAVDGDFLMNGG
jgi:hypothetical protein